MCEAARKVVPGRLIDLSHAVGTVLAHDLTEVRPGECKGPAFKKGHVITAADTDHLRRIGKRHLYVLDLPPEMMHEDEAALALATALAGPGVTFGTNPSEGKINLLAARGGLLKVDESALIDFNMVDGIMCASRHSNTVVAEGQLLAGTRAIPLVIARTRVQEAVRAAGAGIFSVMEMAKPDVGLIITGHEVYAGIIPDRFEPVLRPKIEAFGCRIMRVVLAPDDPVFIARVARELIAAGAGLLVLTGGMSVDPDDVTRVGVGLAGARDILYGAAVLPGAMLMLAEIQGVPVVGVPACGLYYERTIFDLVLPRILAGEKLTRRDLATLSVGGLCLGCETCRYPVCPFGK